jgi:sensor domain CHASE-containing protein
MPTAKESQSWKVLIVILPVVAGSLLGTITTITTNYYSQKMQREEARRKEEAASKEAKMLEQKTQIEAVAKMFMEFMHDFGIHKC